MAGFSLSPEDVLSVDKNILAGTLLLGIEDRGHDATGAAWYSSRSARTVNLHKAPLTAKIFVPKLQLSRGTVNAVLHTRFATQGDKKYAVNNHPIRNGKVVGVHNGMIMNDYTLFQDTKLIRHGRVDSEIIFALLGATDPSMEAAEKALERPRGSIAIGWLDERDEVQSLHLARGSSNPLVVASTTSGSFLFASTKAAIEDAAIASGLVISHIDYLLEGEIVTIVDGKEVADGKFVPNESWSYINYGNSAGVIDSRMTSVSTLPAAKTVDDTPNDAHTSILDWMHYSLLNTTTAFNYTIDEYDSDFVTRENGVEDVVESVKLLDEKAALDVMYRLGAFLRPGDMIRTFFAGAHRDGEIIALENKFPSDLVIVRVMVDGECVILRRKPRELDIIRSLGEIEAEAEQRAAEAEDMFERQTKFPLAVTMELTPPAERAAAKRQNDDLVDNTYQEA